MCNVTVFQVDLTEVEEVGAGSDRIRPGSILVARGQGPSAGVARGFYVCGQGPSTRVVRSLLLYEDDLGSPQLFQASVTVRH